MNKTNDKRHLPFIIDDDLKSMLEGLTGEYVIQHVVSFDITSSVENSVTDTNLP